MVKDHPSYYNLVGQPGSTPHELFEDALSEEKDLLKIHKPSFKALVKVRQQFLFLLLLRERA